MDVSLLLSFVVASAIVSAVVKRFKPEFALAAAVAAASAAIVVMLTAFSPVLTLLNGLASMIPKGEEYLSVLLKCTGSAVLSSLAADICTDCKENALAQAARLTGGAAAVLFALPVFSELVTTAMGFTAG